MSRVNTFGFPGQFERAGHPGLERIEPGPRRHRNDALDDPIVDPHSDQTLPPIVEQPRRVTIDQQTRPGRRKHGLLFTVEGELVVIPIDVCADPRCGCERAVTGIASAKGSTTFTIADRPDLTPDLYTELIIDG